MSDKKNLLAFIIYIFIEVKMDKSMANSGIAKCLIYYLTGENSARGIIFERNEKKVRRPAMNVYCNFLVSENFITFLINEYRGSHYN